MRPVVVLLFVACAAMPAFAYRPFVSTDAAVTDTGDVEVEFGAIGFRSDEGAKSIVAPDVISNLGVAHEGVLQERGTTPSLALELSLLVPTLRGQHSPGGEVVGIMSETAFGWTYHLNGGVLVEPSETSVAPVWGVIVEHALTASVRAVAEVNGESATGAGPDDSALIGAIWEVKAPAPIHGLAFDIGLRHGITHDAAEWGGTAGFTIAFPFRKKEGP